MGKINSLCSMMTSSSSSYFYIQRFADYWNAVNRMEVEKEELSFTCTLEFSFQRIILFQR